MKFVPTHVIYHANCADGFTAAWVGHSRLAEREQIEVIEVPVHHGQESKLLDLGNKSNKLLFVDFCPPRSILLQLKNMVDTIYVIDHHKTAKDESGDLPFTFFDMERSGASLSWDFFYWNMEGKASIVEKDGKNLQKDPMPRLVRYVEDHDLWKFALKDSHEVRSYIKSQKMSFPTWDNLYFKLERDIYSVVKLGSALLEAENEEVELLAKDARIEEIAGFMVPVVNAHSNYSKLAKRLCEIHGTSFAAVYFDRGDGYRQWSLRSVGDFDVSEIAKLYGGGGHQHAAGFESKVPPILIK